MKKLRGNYFRVSSWFILTGFMAGIFLCGVSFAQEDSSHKNVLLLHSYHKGYPFTAAEETGIAQSFLAQGMPKEVRVEYLDTKRIFSDAYFEEFSKFLKYKYSNVKFDVILATDNDAFNFLIKYRQEVFPGVPIVFCGVSELEDKKLVGLKGITGVVEETGYKGNVELALRLLPSTKQIVVVIDQSTTGELHRKRMLAIIPDFKGRADISILSLSDMTLDELGGKLMNLEEGSVVFLLSHFVDRTGKSFGQDESMNFITEKSAVPVFVFTDTRMHGNALGGNLVSAHNQGYLAGVLVGRILRGESPDAIPMVRTGANQIIFDYRQLRRWNIPLKKLPAGTSFVNRPVSFLERNRKMLISVSSIFLMLITIIFILAFNVMRRKEMEEKVKRLNNELEGKVRERTARLEMLNQELEAFSYSVSHDLSAPVRNINGLISVILEDFRDNLNDQARAYLLRIKKSSNHMGQLIDDFLKLARLTRSELKFEKVDLSVMAKEIALELQKTAPDRNVEFILDPGIAVHGDKGLMYIVMSNLLGNAWKFTSKIPAARIEFKVVKNGSEKAYAVRDNGVGFDMAHVEKLFGVFQRLHSQEEFSGTGVGLTVVKRAINRHGGEVWAEGQLNKGATIYFTLPEAA